LAFFAVDYHKSNRLLEDDTIHQWIEYFIKRKTVNDWLGYKYIGYGGKLTHSELKQVEEYVSSNVIINSKQVAQFIKTTFGKKLSTINITKSSVFLKKISIRFLRD